MLSVIVRLLRVSRCYEGSLALWCPMHLCFILHVCLLLHSLYAHNIKQLIRNSCPTSFTNVIDRSLTSAQCYEGLLCRLVSKVCLLFAARLLIAGSLHVTLLRRRQGCARGDYLPTSTGHGQRVCEQWRRARVGRGSGQQTLAALPSLQLLFQNHLVVPTWNHTQGHYYCFLFDWIAQYFTYNN